MALQYMAIIHILKIATFLCPTPDAEHRGILSIKDRTAKTVWQGSLDLRYSKKIKDKDQILPTAVMKIFESYSYQAGSNEPVQISDEKTGN